MKRVYSNEIDVIIRWFEVAGQEKNPGLYYKLITEEYNEVTDAMLDLIRKGDSWKDSTEVAKEVGDLIWVCVLMLHSMDFNPREVIRLIVNSNFSKFARSREEALESLEWYKENRGETGSVREKEGYFVIVRDDGKILKSKASYHEPEWDQISKA